MTCAFKTLLSNLLGLTSCRKMKNATMPELDHFDVSYAIVRKKNEKEKMSHKQHWKECADSKWNL